MGLRQEMRAWLKAVGFAWCTIRKAVFTTTTQNMAIIRYLNIAGLL